MRPIILSFFVLVFLAACKKALTGPDEKPFVVTNVIWEETSLGPVNCIVVSGDNMFAGNYAGVFLSTNNGSTWTPVNTGLTRLHTLSLAVSGTSLFAGTDGGGVFRSTNNGTNWIPVNTGLTDSTILTLGFHGPNIFAGTNGGVFVSSDYGENWNEVNTGLPAHMRIYTFAVNPITNDILLGGGSWGTPLPDAPVILSSANNGLTWSFADSALRVLVGGDGIVTSLAWMNDKMFVGINPYFTEGGIYFSSDNGKGWARVSVADSLRASMYWVSALAISGTTLFAGTGGSGVLLSTDQGTTWKHVGLDDTYLQCLVVSGDNIFAGLIGGTVAGGSCGLFKGRMQ